MRSLLGPKTRGPRPASVVWCPWIKATLSYLAVIRPDAIVLGQPEEPVAKALARREKEEQTIAAMKAKRRDRASSTPSKPA